MSKQYVAICEKVALTIEEVAEYSNIGQNRISSLLKEPRCPFVLYVGTKKLGKRKHKRFKKLQECRAWIADATYVDEHSDSSMPSDMLVDQWFDYWIGIKKKRKAGVAIPVKNL